MFLLFPVVEQRVQASFLRKAASPLFVFPFCVSLITGLILKIICERLPFFERLSPVILRVIDPTICCKIGYILFGDIGL